MNHILTILTDDEHKTEVVKVHVGEIDPPDAAVAVINALKKLKPRKKRSDAGKTRGQQK